jgi:hypothetical protein
MPALNYSMNFDIPNGGSVAIVFIETCRLATDQNKWCSYKGGSISYADELALIKKQLVWIDGMLAAAVAKNPTWLLVVGHYQVRILWSLSPSNCLRPACLSAYLTDRLRDYLYV